MKKLWILPIAAMMMVACGGASALEDAAAEMEAGQEAHRVWGVMLCGRVALVLKRMLTSVRALRTRMRSRRHVEESRWPQLQRHGTSQVANPQIDGREQCDESIQVLTSGAHVGLHIYATFNASTGRKGEVPGLVKNGERPEVLINLVEVLVELREGLRVHHRRWEACIYLSWFGKRGRIHNGKVS